MAHDGQMRDYLDAVGAQIRWRRARRPLLRELEDHITDQARDLEAAGGPRDEALERAVAEMGDPVEVGRALDRLHRPKTSWGLLICALAVMAAGLAAAAMFDGMLYTGRRQLLAACVAVPVLFIACFSDYRLLFRRKWIPGVITVCVLAAAYTPYLFGYRIYYGQNRYLAYAALLLPLLFTGALCLLRGRGKPTVFLCGLTVLLLCVPSMLSPCMAAAFLTAGTALLVLGIAVCRGWFRVKPLPGLLCAWGPAALLALTLLPYFFFGGFHTRLSLFFHPEQEPLGRGWFYQNVRTLLEGIPFSRGLAEPSPFLEHQRSVNDLLLLRLTASYGLCVLLAAGLVILAFALPALRRIRRLSSTSGRLVAHAVLWTLVFQAVTYLIYNLGWGLFGPIAFPLLSPGMVMLVVNAGLVGVLLSVFRMDSLARDMPAPLPE